MQMEIKTKTAWVKSTQHMQDTARVRLYGGGPLARVSIWDVRWAESKDVCALGCRKWTQTRWMGVLEDLWGCGLFGCA
jgi:hypothetical protein